MGNSITPLIFLAVSAILNIGLDLWFVVGLHRGVAGAAEATVISQYVSGVGLGIYTWVRFPSLRPGRAHLRIRKETLREIAGFSMLTCVQQSVMNLGILMVQGLVNSFGTTIMAAFAAAVKIGLRLSSGTGLWQRIFHVYRPELRCKEKDRIQTGLKGAVTVSVLFRSFCRQSYGFSPGR